EREAIADEVVARPVFDERYLQGPVPSIEARKVDAGGARHGQNDVVSHAAIEAGYRTLPELGSSGVRYVRGYRRTGQLQVRADMDRVARNDDPVGGLEHHGIPGDTGEIDCSTRTRDRHVLAGNAVAGDVEAGVQQHFAAGLYLANGDRVLFRDVDLP